jgi:tetratricopeptide (TPR) repeat protein
MKTPNTQVIGISVLLFLAVLAVFGQTAHFEFVGYDDQLYVFQNPVVQKGLSVPAIGWAFTHAQVSNWIPLTTLSHMLDCDLFGLRAGGHHLVNVLWHAANAVLLFLVLRQMTGSLWRNAFVAAIFAVHPLRAESVAWVSERKDVLSGFFFLLTIAAYVRHARQPSRAKYLLVIALFTAGLLAKSMVATLPFVLLLLDYWPLGRMHDRHEFFRLLVEKIPLFVLSVVACVTAAMMPGLLVPDRVPWLERVGNALVSYVIYLRQMAFPAQLAAHYPLLPGGQPWWKICLAFVLLAAVSATVVAWRQRRPALLVGWFWFLGMILPVIGLVQISSGVAHADRYTYLPEIGLAIAVAWAVGDWSLGWKHRPVVLGCCSVAVLLALAAEGYNQTSFWRNDESLWARALACTSDNRGNDFNSVAHNGLGNALAKRGNKSQAIAEYRKALQINPGYKVAHYNLGIALSDSGKTDEAVAEYRVALRLDPNYAEAHNNLGVALMADNEREDAVVEYSKALAVEPDYAEARYNLGNALLQAGNVDAAITQYRQALEVTPKDARILNNLGIALSIKGDDKGALAQYRKALAANPDFVDAHFDLGVALVKDNRLDEAATEYRQALKLNPNYAKARFGLGKVLLRKGDLEAALACFQKPAAINPPTVAIWLNLGDDLLRHEDVEEAIICYRQATEAGPRSAEAYAHFGLALSRKGDRKEAMTAWRQSLAINPDEPDIQNSLAWLLATAPDPSIRDGKKAVELAEKASQSSGGADLMALHTLAAAYAEAGRYADAAATAKRALELGMILKNSDVTAILEKEIKLYQANTPIRDASK